MIDYNGAPQRLDDCPALPATPAQQNILDAVAAAATKAGLAMPRDLVTLTFRGVESVSRGSATRIEGTGEPAVLLDVTRPASVLAHTLAHELSHISDNLKGHPIDLDDANDRADCERRANEFADRVLTQPDVITAVESAGGGPIPSHDCRLRGPVSRLPDCPAMFATPEQRRIFQAVAEALVRDGTPVPPGPLRIFTVRGVTGLPQGLTLRARETGKVSVFLDVTASPRELARACAEQLVHVADVAEGRAFDQRAWERRAQQIAGRVVAQQDVKGAIAEAERTSAS